MGLKEHDSTNDINLTTSQATSEGPSQLLPNRPETCIPKEETIGQMPEQATSRSSTPSTLERMEREMNETNQRTHSGGFSGLLNNQFIDQKSNETKVPTTTAAEFIMSSEHMAKSNGTIDESASQPAETTFEDIADMSPSMLNQLLASESDPPPEVVNNASSLVAREEVIEITAEDANQATDESSFIAPDFSPDTLDRLFGPSVTFPLLEDAVDAANFAGTPLANSDPFAFVSDMPPLPLAPIQQYPYPANPQVYPPLPSAPDDIFRLPNQIGQYPYPPPLRSSSMRPMQALNPSEEQAPKLHVQGDTVHKWVPIQPPGVPSAHAVQHGQPSSRQAQQGLSTLYQDSHPQMPRGQRHPHKVQSGVRDTSRPLATDRQRLEIRAMAPNRGSFEQVQKVDTTQLTYTDTDVEEIPPRSAERVSPGSYASRSSSAQSIIVKPEHPKPRLPKSLAANYYRTYKADAEEKIAKARAANPDHKVSARTMKILEFNPEEHYTPLERPPKPWDIFRYTRYGELEAEEFYTAEEIRRFVYDNPQHSRKGLILWIQRKPGDSGHRYPNHLSQRCRFADCPAKSNLIASGQYRVAFDQQSLKNKDIDPHWNAGYVHLDCLERFLDFPEICKNLTVRPDNRKLRKEPKEHNPMALSSREEVEWANRFIKECRKDRVPTTYPRYNAPNRRHEGTLTHGLSHTKLEIEPKTAKTRRHNRETKTMLELHMGDLVVYTRLDPRSNAAAKTKRTMEARRQKATQAYLDHDREPEGSDGDSSSEHQRPRKRQRRQRIPKVEDMELEDLLAGPLLMEAKQRKSVDEDVEVPAGPLTRAKKRSRDQDAEESRPKREKSSGF